MKTPEKNRNRKTLDELKKEKGRTVWAKLISEEKSSNKKCSRRKKRAADFGVSQRKSS